MVFFTSELITKYDNYTDAKGKIRRLVQKEKLIPITKGLYEDDIAVNPLYLAPWICSPSYISFDYALSLYGLIPEAVYAYTSATFGKRKIKEYRNAFGFYVYRDVPKTVYPYGVLTKIDAPYSYNIASREKALCDKLYSIKPVKNQKELRYLLFDDLRIDEDAFWAMNMDDILFIAPLYHSSNLDHLAKLIHRHRRKMMSVHS